jgi:RsiW-degrading membrane proteinase PrsW (M82 family)
LVRKAPAFDQYYDGIIYAVFVSMGFALIENIMYVMNGDMTTVITRAVMAVPGHMLFAVAMGYYFSMSKFDSPQKAKVHVAMSLAVPMLLHGTYDFLLMYTGAKSSHSPLMAVGIIIVFVIFDIYLWKLGIKRIKAHKAKDLGMG